MTVTLIIPFFNAEAYLAECLDSIIAQSYKEFKVLLIDDGSTDSSADICRRYCQCDSRFQLIRQPNRGVSAARNVGINAVADGYIGFVDADDCLYPEALKVMTKTISETGAQVCIAAFETGIKYRNRKATKSPNPPQLLTYSQAMKIALYQKHYLNSAWGMLMERNLLGNDIRFREGIRYEDLDAFYRFYEQAKKIAYIPQSLYFYRQVGNSFMHSWSPNRLDALDVTDRIVEYMQHRHPEIVDAAIDRRFSAHFNIMLLLLRLGIKDKTSIDRTWGVIKKNRRKELSNSNVRIKNKLGALASFGGLKLMKLLSKIYL